MSKFSQRSIDRLSTCDPRLQLVLRRAIERIDFVVICGHRNKQEQDAAVFAKTTKLAWPNSKHNSLPSLAVDIVPSPFYAAMWKQREPWEALAQVVLQCAAELDVKIRWGGDWNGDGRSSDERFFDGPHFELV